MALIEWTDEFSVGVAAIDAQHKRLVTLANELNESALRGNDKTLLKTALNDLLDYIAHHFTTEEKLFERYSYPDQMSHKREHETFSWIILDMRGKFNQGDQLQTSELVDYLTNWIKTHILQVDKKYATFFSSKGVH